MQTCGDNALPSFMPAPPPLEDDISMHECYDSRDELLKAKKIEFLRAEIVALDAIIAALIAAQEATRAREFKLLVEMANVELDELENPELDELGAIQLINECHAKCVKEARSQTECVKEARSQTECVKEADSQTARSRKRARSQNARARTRSQTVRPLTRSQTGNVKKYW